MSYQPSALAGVLKATVRVSTHRNYQNKTTYVMKDVMREGIAIAMRASRRQSVYTPSVFSSTGQK